MHQEIANVESSPASAAASVLRMARQLHKAAIAGSPSQSLPVLRRVLATQSLRGLGLAALFESRAQVRRKHVLRTVAIEAGYESWEDYRSALKHLRAAELAHFDLLRSTVGYPNHWFASLEQAQQFATVQGGRVISVGQQAVVVAELN